MLNRRSEQQQLVTLSNQVEQLKAIGDTLRKYLEALVSQVTPKEGKELIESEQKRLEELSKLNLLRRNAFFMFLVESLRIPSDDAINALRSANSYKDFLDRLSKGSPTQLETLRGLFKREEVRRDFSEARGLLGKEGFPDPIGDLDDK